MLKVRLNHQIKAPTLRVISEEGEQVGIMTTSEALVLAQANGLDLVEVSPVANPPVAKLIDFAKYKYQQKKIEQMQKKKAKMSEVRIELRMRGREQAFGDQGRTNLEKFLTYVKFPYRTEVPIRRMGGTFSITIAPAKLTPVK